MGKQVALIEDEHEDESTGEESDERGEDEEDAAAELPPEPVKPARPKARRATLAASGELNPRPSPFGAVPDGVSWWGVRKKNHNGEFETMGWQSPGATTREREWPLADLSEKTLQDRWGAGVYEIWWVRSMPRGGRRTLRGGRELEILEPKSPAAAAPPLAPGAPAGIFAGAVGEAFQVVSALESMADKKVEAMASLAAMLVGQRGGGLGAAELQLILKTQQEDNMRMMKELLQPMQQQIAALQSADDDDDEPGPATAAVAGAADVAKTFIKGKGGWNTAFNFLAGNPAIVQAALPSVIDLVKSVANNLSNRPAQQPAPLIQQQLPVARRQPTMAPPPPPPVYQAPPAPRPPTITPVAIHEPTPVVLDAHGNPLATSSSAAE